LGESNREFLGLSPKYVKKKFLELIAIQGITAAICVNAA
jgi:hypothetical protein